MFNNLLSAIERIKVDNVPDSISDMSVISSNSGRPAITELGLYTIMSQGSKVFRESLNNNDEKYKYTVPSKEKESKDPEKVKEKVSSFDAERKEVDRLVDQWRDDNKDAFVTTLAIPNVSKYCNKNLNIKYSANVIKDVDISYYLFRSFEDALAKYLDKNKDKIMLAERRVISPDWSSDFQKVKNDIRKEIGLPTNKEIKDMVEDTIMVKSQSLRRTKANHNNMSNEIKKEAMSNALDYSHLLIENFKNTSVKVEE